MNKSYEGLASTIASSEIYAKMSDRATSSNNGRFRTFKEKVDYLRTGDENPLYQVLDYAFTTRMLSEEEQVQVNSVLEANGFPIVVARK